MRQELSKLGGAIDVHITHIKPGERAAVMDAMMGLRTTHGISALENFQEFTLA